MIVFWDAHSTDGPAAHFGDKVHIGGREALLAKPGSSSQLSPATAVMTTERHDNASQLLERMRYIIGGREGRGFFLGL